MSQVYFIDGLDWGTQSQLLPTAISTPQKYVNYSSGGSAAIQPGRVTSPRLGGGNSGEFENAAFSQATMTRMLGVKPTLCLGFAYDGSGGTPDTTSIIRIEAGHATLIDHGGFDDGTNLGTVIWLEQLPDLTINVYAGDGTQCGTPNFPGTFLATLNTVFTRTAYRYVELVVSSTGWAIYVDDVLDTMQSIAMPIGSGMDRYSFQKFSAENYRVDDHYAADSRLGPCRVTAFPPAVQSTHQWTPLSGTNLSQVSEFGDSSSRTIPDGDVTYVSSENDGEFDLYLWDKPACYGRILALALNVDARAVTGTPSLTLIMKSNGVIYDLLFSDPLTTSYSMVQAVMQTNPATGATWTDADIANVMFGYQKSGGGSARVTQIFLEKLVSLRSVAFDCGQGSYSFTQP